MANLTVDNFFNFPALAGQVNTLAQPEITPTGGTAIPSGNLNLHVDSTATDISTAAGSLTASNAMIFTPALRAQGNVNADGYDFTDVVVNLTAASAVSDVWNGTNSFVRTNFYLSAPTGGRHILGQFTETNKATNNLTMTDCNFISTGANSALAFLVAGLNIQNLNLNGVSFIGSTNVEATAGFLSGGTAWADLGFDSNSTGQFSIRVTHHNQAGLPRGNDNNFPTITSLPQTKFALFTGDDFSSVARLGSATSFQWNQAAGSILISPLTGGRNIPCTFHQNPTATTDSRASAVTFIGWKPLWQDDLTLDTVTDAIVRMPERTVFMPEIAGRLEGVIGGAAGYVPDFNTNARNANVDLPVGTIADYRGLLVQDFQSVFNDNSANQVISFSGNTGGVVDAGITAKTGGVWSFSHNITRELTTPTRTVTNSNGDTDDVYHGTTRIGVDDFTTEHYVTVAADAGVDNTVAADANLPGDNNDNLDQAYRALKRQWYDNRVGVEYPLSVTGTTVVVENGNLQLSDTLDTEVDTAAAGALHDFRTSALAGGTLNAIRTGANRFNANNIPVTNMTLDGNVQLLPSFDTLHFEDGTMIEQRVDRDIRMENFTVPVDAGGDPTGTVTVNAGTGNSAELTVTTAQNALLTAGAGITLTVEDIPPTHTVRIAGTLAEIQGAGGFFVVTNAADNSIVVARHAINNTSTEADISYGADTADTNVYNIYYQPASNFTPGSVEIFRPALTVLNSSAIGGTEDTTINANINRYSDGFFTGITQALSANVTPAASLDADGVAQWTIDQGEYVGGDAAAILVAITHNGLLTDAIANAGLDNTNAQNPLQFGIAANGLSVTINNGWDGTGVRPAVAVIRFDSVAATLGIAATGLVPGATTVDSNSKPNVTSSLVVTQVVSLDSAATALDSSARLQDIDNKTSWLVTDGSTTPSVDGSRLVGIRPKGDDYDPGVTYTTVT